MRRRCARLDRVRIAGVRVATGAAALKQEYPAAPSEAAHQVSSCVIADAAPQQLQASAVDQQVRMLKF